MSGLAWLVWLGGIGCGSPEPTPAPEPDADAVDVVEDVDVEIPTLEHTLDPTAGDPSVSAELGGPGFTGEGWTTNLTVSNLGNVDAPQGGEIVEALPDWPVTLRFAGKDYNTWYNYHWRSQMLMSLLDLDPVTLEPVPALATHWQRNDDDTLYRFRLDPRARWSDGTPVTSEDFVATYDLLTDESLLDPSTLATLSKFERPEPLSPYVFEVKVKEPRWQNFLLFVEDFYPFPAHEIRELEAIEGKKLGEAYLDVYQNKYTAVNGPYIVKPGDIELNQSLVLTRRDDWWAEDIPAFDGRYNIARKKYVVVKDAQLQFEKIKKGELDYFVVPRAQWWAEDIPAHPWVQRGLLRPLKFFTNAPIGTNGFALNLRRDKLKDVRVRQALQHLLDRETMLEKLYYGEYEPLTSYWQYGPYQNPDNPPMPYDEFAAVELLEDAGWTEKNDEGYRVRDGEVLQLEVIYGSPLTEPPITMWQESAKKAGIKLDLKLLTPPSLWKQLREKQYDIANVPWGALIFPNPSTAWSSDLAEKTDNNNVTSLADPRVDALIEKYDQERVQEAREAIIRELDELIYSLHPYVLEWYKPSQRVLVTNKFGFPEPWGSARFAEDTGDKHLVDYWWVDPARVEALEAAKADETIELDGPKVEWRFWEQWSKARLEASASVDAAPIEAPDE